MTTPEERVFEVALEEVAGGVQPPDLEPSLLARIRFRRNMGRVAAALFLLTATLTGLHYSFSEPPPVPKPAETPLLTGKDEFDLWRIEGPPRKSRHLGMNELALVQAGKDFTLAGGGECTAKADSLLEGRPGRQVRLIHGSLRAMGKMRLQVGTGALELTPQAIAEISLLVDRPLEPESFVRGWQARGKPKPGIAFINVIRGSVTMNSPEGGARVKPGEQLAKVPGQPPQILRKPDPGLGLRAAGWLTEILVDEAGLTPAQHARRQLAAMEMLAHLTENPRDWNQIRGEMFRPWTRNLPPDRKWQLLVLMAYDPNPAMGKKIREGMAGLSAERRNGLYLQMAENDDMAAESSLQERLTNHPDEKGLLLPAAYFALRKRGEWQPLLSRFSRGVENLQKEPAHYLACAAGLDHLGTSETWKRAVTHERELIELELSRERLEEVRTVLLRLAYFVEGRATGRQILLGDLERRIELFIYRRSAGLSTARQIREYMKKIFD